METQTEGQFQISRSTQASMDRAAVHRAVSKVDLAQWRVSRAYERYQHAQVLQEMDGLEQAVRALRELLGPTPEQEPRTVWQARNATVAP